MLPTRDNEAFLKAALADGIRVDGRGLHDPRPIQIHFGNTYGHVEVTLGRTRVLCIVAGEVVAPYADRPNEGFLSFNVDYGPMASPLFELGRTNEAATEVCNLVERLLKGSRAIDVESLCILGGAKVWSLRVDIRALDDDGNLCDASALAALCGVLHFRKLDVTLSGSQAIIHSSEEREPVPLSVHHLPVLISFAFFDDAETFVVDPSSAEESVMRGRLSVAVNQHGDLCAIHKAGGLPIDMQPLQHCMQLAVSRGKDVAKMVMDEIEKDKQKRREARRNIHKKYEDAPVTVPMETLPAQKSEDVEMEPAPAAAPPEPPPAPSAAAAAAAPASSIGAKRRRESPDTPNLIPTPAPGHSSASPPMAAGRRPPTQKGKVGKQRIAPEMNNFMDLTLESDEDVAQGDKGGKHGGSGGGGGGGDRGEEGGTSDTSLDQRFGAVSLDRGGEENKAAVGQPAGAVAAAAAAASASASGGAVGGLKADKREEIVIDDADEDDLASAVKVQKRKSKKKKG